MTTLPVKGSLGSGHPDNVHAPASRTLILLLRQASKALSIVQSSTLRGFSTLATLDIGSSHWSRPAEEDFLASINPVCHLLLLSLAVLSAKCMQCYQHAGITRNSQFLTAPDHPIQLEYKFALFLPYYKQ